MKVKKEAAAVTATQKTLQLRFYPNQDILASLKSELGSLLLNVARPLPADLRAYRWGQIEKTLSQFTLLKYQEVR